MGKKAYVGHLPEYLRYPRSGLFLLILCFILQEFTERSLKNSFFSLQSDEREAEVRIRAPGFVFLVRPGPCLIL